MKIIETLIKTAIPGVAVLVALFPFFCMLNAEDRFEAFSKILDLLFGNVVFCCIIVVLAFVIVSMHGQKKETARIHAEEKLRLENENKTLKEDLQTFTREVLAITEKKDR